MLLTINDGHERKHDGYGSRENIDGNTGLGYTVDRKEQYVKKMPCIRIVAPITWTDIKREGGPDRVCDQGSSKWNMAVIHQVQR